MYELIKINDTDYYIECPARIGVYKVTENDVIIIDSGNDKDTAKKVLKILKDNCWNLISIFNTHSHADHIGGNNYLQDKTHCEIYANDIESAYTNYPLLEPITLYGGLPFKDIENKFILARDSIAKPFTDNALPKGLTLIQLPGHSYNMIGFLTANGTAYIADSISSVETIKKYGIGYLWNYLDSINTLNYLKSLKASFFVPSHVNPTDSISSIIDYNINSIVEVAENIIDICSIPTTFDDILRKLFDKYSMNMTIQQYVLIGSTVKSYLSSLYAQGKIEYLIQDNKICWHSC